MQLDALGGHLEDLLDTRVGEPCHLQRALADRLVLLGPPTCQQPTPSVGECKSMQEVAWLWVGTGGQAGDRRCQAASRASRGTQWAGWDSCDAQWRGNGLARAPLRAALQNSAQFCRMTGDGEGRGEGRTHRFGSVLRARAVPRRCAERMRAADRADEAQICGGQGKLLRVNEQTGPKKGSPEHG
jgi:hypothetical protein